MTEVARPETQKRPRRPGGGGTPPRRTAGAWRVLLRPEAGLPVVLAALCVYLGFASEYFWRWQNLLNITQAVSVVGIAAAFATVVVIAGGLDLSPVAVMAMSGIVVAEALDAGAPVLVAVALALLAGVAIGLLNGGLIALLRLNPFIVTLGTMFFFTGIAFVVTDGTPRDIERQSFLDLGQAELWFDIPVDTLWMLGAFALAFFLLRATRFGIHVHAVGGDDAAARLSGVRVIRVKLLVYTLAGLAAGTAGMVQAANAGQVSAYAASSSNDLLTIIAAVIIGGTALAGGRGTVIGTLVGILLLGVIQNGLTLLNISSFWQPVVIGAILLIAIVLDELRRRIEGGR